jgi:biotin carboxyl carrier protein
MVRTDEGSFSAVAVVVGDSTLVSYRGRQYRIGRKPPARDRHHATAAGEMRAPMPGMIVEVSVEPGQKVVKGQPLLVLEAMKMHQTFSAPFDGTVGEVSVEKGTQVAEGQPLVVVEAE